jgi:hypothetical protein
MFGRQAFMARITALEDALGLLDPSHPLLKRLPKPLPTDEASPPSDE